MNLKIDEINTFLQKELRVHGLQHVRSVEAAKWLNRADLLKDSKSRPGKMLRKLLRGKLITGGKQIPNRKYGRWFINRSK